MEGLPGRGHADSHFETDTISRDDLRYYGKSLTDPINTVEVRPYRQVELNDI